MSTFVNVWPGRWRGTDQPVSTLVSTKWAVPAGSALACFTQRLTHDLHASAVGDPAVVCGVVRTVGAHSGVRTELVRTGGLHSGSQLLTREWGESKRPAW